MADSADLGRSMADVGRVADLGRSMADVGRVADLGRSMADVGRVADLGRSMADLAEWQIREERKIKEVRHRVEIGKS